MSSATTDPAAAAAAAGAAVESHAADEASGPGEVVFSSDGLNPPAPVQLRPPPIRQTQTAASTSIDGGGNGVDYTNNVSVEQAFEAFAGKLYYPSEKKVVVGSSSSSFTTKRSTTETDLERLQRLHAEVKELESDLRQQGSSQQGDDNGDPSLAMLASIQQIKTRLEAQQNNVAMSLLQQQEALTRHVANSTRTLNEPLLSAPEATTATSLSASSPAGENAAILARLQKLEAVLGSSAATATAIATNNTNDASSLLQRLAVLEKSMSRLDEKELEALTKKAKVIRQDLEAASKARSKLLSVVTTGSASSAGGSSATNASSGTSSSINIRAEDSKTITDLHDELVQLQGMTTHLPLLAQRLQSLALLHASSATYASRLNAIEDLAVQKLPLQVAVLEQALSKMELNLQTSAQQMMENVQALQQRVDQLSP